MFMKYYINKKLSFIFVLFVFIIFFILICISNQKNNVIKYKFNLTNINLKPLNYIVVVGDSRMEFIENNRNNLNIPNSLFIDAKSGARINWLIDTGLPTLYNIINNRLDNVQYHVIFNLGVNDINDINDINYDIDINKRAEEYFKIYRNLINIYKDIKFYILSVNPVDESRIYIKFPYNKRTNNKIEQFNNYFIGKLNSENFDNVEYCDSYNNLTFNLPDGLHFDDYTDQKIIDYIINGCVDFK